MYSMYPDEWGGVEPDVEWPVEKGPAARGLKAIQTRWVGPRAFMVSNELDVEPAGQGPVLDKWDGTSSHPLAPAYAKGLGIEKQPIIHLKHPLREGAWCNPGLPVGGPNGTVCKTCTSMLRMVQSEDLRGL